MAIANEELDHEHHLAFYKGLGFLTGDPDRDAHWHREAEYMHVLSVCDAIRDVPHDAVVLSQRVCHPEDAFHLRFGVARRSQFIWHALRNVLELIHPSREEPLAMDSVHEAAMSLNVIYINIRGTLDNFAWCLRDLFGTDQARRLPPLAVHLFGKDFLADANLREEAAFLEGFTAWNNDLKKRRDPAAHRIPLSVPPAVLVTHADKQQYDRTSAEYDEAVNVAVKTVGDTEGKLALLEKAGLVYEQLERIGAFIPVFSHHPDEGHVRIYPTVPQDIGQLVKIARGLTAIISRKLAQ